MTRDVAPRLGFLKPAVIHSKFFPALQGPKTKMSASDPNSAIFMTDTPNEVEVKVKKYAYSGGRATVEEHRKLGGDAEVDIPYQYLSVFEFRDENLKRIHDEYTSGHMLSGEIKQELINVLTPFILAHQKARVQVTDEMVERYMKVRPLEFRFVKK
jgi:tryptophanyl-tRNA synthetase